MQNSPILQLCIAISLGGCGTTATTAMPSESTSTNINETQDASQKNTAEVVPTLSKEEQKKEEQKKAQRIADVTASMEWARGIAEEDGKRWTPELKKKANILAKKKHNSTRSALKVILKSEHRQPGNSDRDTDRHPAETLNFFGITPTMHVVEVGAGMGWYTEVLAPLLAVNGKLSIASYDPNGPRDSRNSLYGLILQLFLDHSPEIYGKVEPVYIDPPTKLRLGPDGSADAALAIREMHNWHRRAQVKDYVTAIHKVLKPGGIFGVVQHRANPNSNPDETAPKGYLPEEWLIQQVVAEGFQLVKKSDINNNSEDTKDYEQGVWTLPPFYMLKDKDREKYKAIGESDRMTLKFKKIE